jgi:hypothetical protein
MVESRHIAEFKISKELLLKSLLHISHICDRAVVGIIENQSDNNAKMGISINNEVNAGDSEHQFDLYSSYPVFNSEMIDFKYNIDKWPVVYIACTNAFINSINTLPPIVVDDEEVLEMVIWDIKDDGALKSEVCIFGDHHSRIGSIIQYSDIIDEKGHVVSAKGSNIDVDQLKHYT